jgi:hypothetical protein
MYLSRITTALVTVIILSTSLTAGGIKGTVKYDGKVPKMRPIKMAADPICNGLHTEGPARLEWLLAGPNGELKNVFVYVEKDLKERNFLFLKNLSPWIRKGVFMYLTLWVFKLGKRLIS